ncbi:PREDICTED: uncharacterized protein LOC108776809 [Cyphomyrmex costatus]|uniref:uncharacterized protein LOC108776809 n=1 Tax=Cyphomyrmex costatus TaxID=456900 RepID=UPI0008523BC4|nr:PREDICTED: uncharacterized protein LOC108776809 [Cyphomyrmex costatus]
MCIIEVIILSLSFVKRKNKDKISDSAKSVQTGCYLDEQQENGKWLKKKRQYGKWSPNSMNTAIKEYSDCKITLNKLERKYGIPKKTFLRHYRNQVARGTERVNMDSVNTSFDTRLANQIVEQNSLPNPFNKETQTAGKKWYYSFMKRHPELSLRQPEKLSISRVKDESGFQTVQKKNPKVLAMKGRKRVGALTSAERGVNTTVVCCTNAVGVFIPPMIIFKRLRMDISLASGAPAESLVEISETGYINSELFLKWFKHFLAYVRPSKENKVLLLLDGHTTHSKNLNVINLACENGVLLLQLPGHTTHRLQPLDVSIFKPFQLYYDEAVVKWHRTNPPPPLRQCHVSTLLSEAYLKIATMSNAVNGFKATGIWPVDRHIFNNTDFIAVDTLMSPENCQSPENEIEETIEGINIHACSTENN